MRVLGGFVQEDVLHDDALHRRQGSIHMLGVGVRLRNVFALAIQGFETAIQRGLKHIGNAQAGLGADGHTPCSFELAAHRGVGHMAVAGQLVREAAHVATALHIVLATQGVDAHALTPHHAARHGQVGNAQHHGRTLRMLGHTQTIVDGRVGPLGKQAGRSAHFGSGHASDRLKRFG